jgi:histidinol-phosphate aminotransferase
VSLAHRVKPWIPTLEPYKPGKPIEELALELASNENPLGPSPRAIEAVRRILDDAHRYPDGASFALRTRLAAKLGVCTDQLVFGCGADEILELVAKCFLGPGDEGVFAWPSFAMYPIVTRGMGATPVAVPLDRDLVHDLDAMLGAVTERTRVVLVCNPNNPTGTSVGADAFARFAERLPADVVLVIDEAYVDFARRPDFPDGIAWVQRRPGTLVARTFSKISGLAGLRVGFGVADPELTSYLERARHPFNVNLLAEAAAVAALDDDAHVKRTVEQNGAGIDFLRRELGALGIETWPSEANFVLAKPGPGTYERLLREGVIVRPLGGFGMPNHVRITIGLPEENERLVKALRRLVEEGAR